MFNNAPTVVFIANDPAYDMSQIDCGLLGENMILSAWSMGIVPAVWGACAFHEITCSCRIYETVGIQ